MHKASAPITDPKRQRQLTQLLGFIVFFSVLNGTMFNVSIPDIAAEFDLLPSGVSWVMTAYIITFALGAAVYGKLADIYPTKNLITLGLILLSAGSLVGLLSRWYPMLVMARFLQASGGASIPALGMLIATQYFPQGIKGRVLGVVASTVAFSGGVGPVLGGFITATFHWRYLFIFSFITLITIPSFRRLLPDEEKKHSSFDTPGALMMGTGAASLLLFVTRSGWWFLLLSGAAFALFALHIRRARNPFVDTRLLNNGSFRGAVASASLCISTVFGMFFMTPIMLREINGLDAGRIGLVIFPGAMCAAILGTLGGRLVDRIGGVKIAYSALGILTFGYLLLSTFAGAGPIAITLILMVCYAGFSVVQSSFAHTVSNTLPREYTGIGMGIYNMCFFMAGAFSASVLGRLLDFKTSSYCINPFTACTEAWLFSNLFVLIAAVVVAAFLIFLVTFGKTQPAPRS